MRLLDDRVACEDLKACFDFFECDYLCLLLYFLGKFGLLGFRLLLEALIAVVDLCEKVDTLEDCFVKSYFIVLSYHFTSFLDEFWLCFK